MKNIKRISLAVALLTAMFTFSCTDILEEQPRSIYEPGYFETEKGVEGGLTAMYAHLRYIYGGNSYLYATFEVGTDEYTWGQSGEEANFLDPDFSGRGQFTASTSRADALWEQAFTNINTANGVIENATKVGLPASLIAEARFFRALDYFLLVQTFGGVPLDLGSGELAFNTTPSRTSVRNTVPEVYKAIFTDLEQAVADLPTAPRLQGAVAKTVARLFLSKAYLTYAWWLQSSIPTFPEVPSPRTDPNGKTAQEYYQLAYNIATQAIDDPGQFGLQPTFYDVNLATNDRNNEILLYADHTEESAYYNGGSLTNGDQMAADNCVTWMVSWNYAQVLAKEKESDQWPTPSPVVRQQIQSLGRPWTRMAPTVGVFKKTFADKTNDSRYDGTFTTVYRANWSTDPSAVLYNANGLPIHPGDAVITFLDEDDPAITYLVKNVADKGKGEPPTPGSVGLNQAGGGLLPGRADYVVGPSAISRYKYPAVWKLGPYRVNGITEGNAPSLRPFPIAKFSELYLIAAEAAVQGASGSRSARDLVNVLRARAGKWRWHNAGGVEKIEDHSAEMIAATPAVDIDYILAERSRELFAEGYRWHDLIRTQKWEEYAREFEICGDLANDQVPKETMAWDVTLCKVTRTIKPGHYLRPIPQTQLDGLEMTEDEKRLYQNPEYRTN
jgi:hypothetical protein